MFGDSTLCTSLLTIWFYYKGICLSIYLSISLSIIVSIYQSIYLSIYLSVCLSVRPSVCLSVYLSICLPVYLSTCLSTYLSICLPVYLSIYLPVCLFIINPMSYSTSRTRYCIMKLGSPDFRFLRWVQCPKWKRKWSNGTVNGRSTRRPVLLGGSFGRSLGPQRQVLGFGSL